MKCREITAVFTVTLAAATLPGCEERGRVTTEGPNPIPDVSALSPEMRETQLAVQGEVRKLMPRFFETYVRDEHPSDRTLIAAHARAKEFAERGRYFADDSYLPGGLRTWNSVLPIEAQAVFEKIMVERGINFE